LVVVDPDSELDFLHDLPVELMWGVGSVTRVRLTEIGVHTIGQLAEIPGGSLERLLGRAAEEKLTALAWNRDPRVIKAHRRARSA
jgi:DNA polymerase-4